MLGRLATSVHNARTRDKADTHAVQAPKAPCLRAIFTGKLSTVDIRKQLWCALACAQNIRMLQWSATVDANVCGAAGSANCPYLYGSTYRERLSSVSCRGSAVSVECAYGWNELSRSADCGCFCKPYCSPHAKEGNFIDAICTECTSECVLEIAGPQVTLSVLVPPKASAALCCFNSCQWQSQTLIRPLCNLKRGFCCWAFACGLVAGTRSCTGSRVHTECACTRNVPRSTKLFLCLTEMAKFQVDDAHL